MNTTSFDLAHYGRVVVRQWRLLCACIALGVVGAGLFLLASPPRVTAVTQVNLSIITTDPFNPQRAASGLLDDATESAIAGSHVVAERAAARLGGDTTASDLRDAVAVSISEGGTVARVSASADDRDAAVSRADAMAAAYLAYRSEQAAERRDVMVAGLDERIADLNDHLSETNERLAGDPDQVQATSDREQILVELEGLLSQRNVLQSVDTTGGSVLTAAADSPASVGPSRLLALGTGIAAGVVLGIVAAFAVDPWDRRLRTAAEIERRSGARVLARLATPDARFPQRPEDAAALRLARERILAAREPGARSILVVDDSGSDDADVASGLAVAFAHDGHPVVLVPERVTGTPADHTGRTGAAHGEGGRTTTLVSLPGTAGAAELLAHLRTSDACLAVLREGRSTTTSVDRLRALVDESGRTFLGSIVVPRQPRAHRVRATDIARDGWTLAEPRTAGAASGGADRGAAFPERADAL